MTNNYHASIDHKTSNYGIYDCMKSNKLDRTKSIGIITRTEYVFRTDIGDHYCEGREIEDEIGEGDFRICVHKRSELVQELFITQDRNTSDANKFELYTLRKIVQEAKRFADEGNIVNIELPEAAAEDGKYHSRLDACDALALIKFVPAMQIEME